ncbi:MAG: hypothetical protein B6I34_11020 [Anaerolineaceae bacterium 4572_32.1]|nr:MAG: hypothetical protein B6I34_11020 [Anaerolineaceae bacterium 4572_32.1]
MKKHMLLTIVTALAVFSMMLVGCQPQTVTVTVQVPVEQTVEVPVMQTVEVEVPTGGEVVHIVARCKASPPYEEGRCNNLVAAVGAANQALADAGDSRRIELESIQDDADWGDYKTEFELASDAGEAPDIVCSGHEHIGDWATAGYLTDITDMIGDYPEFADVIDSLWTATELGGKRWGVPQDAEARPMYYSKPLLRELGWTDEEVESLDERVAAGEFTWEDMLDTAAQAVEAGVVEPGNGWWHRPSNGPDFLYYYYATGGEVTGETDALVFDQDAALKVYEMLYDAAQVRNIIRPDKLDGDWDHHKEYTSKFDKVLFVFEGTWRWASWHTNYLQDLGGEDYLFENVGFAPIPARADGTGKPTTLTHPLVYMISSQCEHPDLASAKFLSMTLPLLEYTTFLPNSPYWSTWSEAYYLGIQAVESGDLTPEEAVAVVVDQLQNNLGDNVIVR